MVHSPKVAPWAELGAPAVPPAPSGGKSWRSAPAGRSDSRLRDPLAPAVRQDELSAVEPEVLVERHEPEVLETSGPGPPAAAVEAGTVAAAASTTRAAGIAAADVTAGSGDGCCCRKQLEGSSSSYPPSPGACTPC